MITTNKSRTWNTSRNFVSVLLLKGLNLNGIWACLYKSPLFTSAMTTYSKMLAICIVCIYNGFRIPGFGMSIMSLVIHPWRTNDMRRVYSSIFPNFVYYIFLRRNFSTDILRSWQLMSCLIILLLFALYAAGAEFRWLFSWPPSRLHSLARSLFSAKQHSICIFAVWSLQLCSPSGLICYFAKVYIFKLHSCEVHFIKTPICMF